MARSRSSFLRALNGLFSVYKPPGILSRDVYETLHMKLLKDLNFLHQHSSKDKMLFLPESSEGSSRVELTKVVTSVPSLVDHVLVKGPAYTHLKMGVGHRLDRWSSGVLVFGIGLGGKLLTDMHDNHYTRDYTVCGTFGKATSDFSDAGRVIEKTTFDHITRDKLERVLAMIQGVNQKALIMNSQVDLQSQEAYDLAVQGQLRPKVKSPPLILAMQCLEFSPPDFTLEIRCMHETQKYLRKLIHEIGLELRSSAICTKVRRTRDGPFTLDCALTRAHWDIDSVSNAIKESHSKVQEILKEKMDFILRNSDSEALQSPEEKDTQSN